MYSPRDGRFEGTFSRQDPQGESLDSATERQGQYFSRSIRPAWKSPESAQQAPSRQRDLLSTSSVYLEPEVSTSSLYSESEESRVSTHLPDMPIKAEPTQVLCSWDGVVVAIGRETFKARIIPIGEGGPEQLAEFSLKDISPGDETLFSHGALFYWTISYRTYSGRRTKRESEVRFRRLPPPPTPSPESDADWLTSTKRLFDRDDAAGTPGS